MKMVDLWLAVKGCEMLFYTSFNGLDFQRIMIVPFSERTCIYLWGLLKEFPKEFGKCFTATKQTDEKTNWRTVYEEAYFTAFSSSELSKQHGSWWNAKNYITHESLSTVSLWHFLELCIQMADKQIFMYDLKTLVTIIIQGKLVCIHFLKFVKWWRTWISTQWSLLQMLPLCNFFKNRFLYFWQLFKVITKALNEALQY